jgi:hypothetical protein
MENDESHTALGDALVLLKQKLEGYCCSVCGNDQFALIERPLDQLRTNIHLFRGDDPLAKKHVELITIACLSCGHVEQFVERVLQDQLASATVK